MDVCNGPAFRSTSASGVAVERSCVERSGGGGMAAEAGSGDAWSGRGRGCSTGCSGSGSAARMCCKELMMDGLTGRVCDAAAIAGRGSSYALCSSSHWHWHWHWHWHGHWQASCVVRDHLPLDGEVVLCSAIDWGRLARYSAAISKEETGMSDFVVSTHFRLYAAVGARVALALHAWLAQAYRLRRLPQRACSSAFPYPVWKTSSKPPSRGPVANPSSEVVRLSRRRASRGLPGPRPTFPPVRGRNSMDIACNIGSSN